MGLEIAFGILEVKFPEFLGSRHMKVTRLSAISTGRLYPPPQEIPLVIFSVRR